MLPARSNNPGVEKSIAQAPHKQQARMIAWTRSRRWVSEVASARHQPERAERGESFTSRVRISSFMSKTSSNSLAARVGEISSRQASLLYVYLACSNAGRLPV